MKKRHNPMHPVPLELREIDSLQDYYFDGEDHYSVARLVDAARGLKPFDLPIAGINLSDEIWRGCNIYGLAFHVKKVFDADFKNPIILDWNGCIADGRHRIIKAIIEGRQTIQAVRITWRLDPDRRGKKAGA